MGLIVSWVFLYSGRLRVFPVIIGIAWVLLLFRPDMLLYDASFGLSFGATLGIILFGDYFSKQAKHLPFFARFFLIAIGIPLSATLGSLPALLYHFGAFSWVGIIANIAVGFFM